MLHDYLTSLVRTAVPAGVAVALAWLATNAGIVLDEDTSGQITAAAVGVALVGYYALVRALETRWPAFGRLLGRKAAPTYSTSQPSR